MTPSILLLSVALTSLQADDWNVSRRLQRPDIAPQTQSQADPDSTPLSSGAVGAPIGLTLLPSTAVEEAPCEMRFVEPWSLQILPGSLIWHSYLASVKEPRFASVWANGREEGWVWDVTLGGRIGLWRYGTQGNSRPEGWQLDMEGAAFPRLDLSNQEDLVAVDFRFGFPVTYGQGPYQMKLGAYHLSSHAGDEFLLSHPLFTRINYGRNALVWANSYFLDEATRVYAEVGWAFDSEISGPWEYQFGVDYSPMRTNAHGGAPFAAINTHLRQEVNFGGNVVVQAGWQWRHGREGRLWRTGLQYFDGKDDQFEFYNRNEQKIGLGLWYDY